MNATTDLSRRRFLQVSAVAGGGLLVGFSLGSPAEAQTAPATTASGARFEPNAWIRVASDGAVTIVCPRNEMGQDVYNSLTMLVTEELAVDPRRVTVEQAPVNPVYINKMLGGQITGGSTSVRDAWEPLRHAGAATRIVLVNAAAAQWKVSTTECRAENGYVVHGNQRLSYGELASAAAKQAVPKNVPLKPVNQFTVIGKPLPRLDGADKARGRTVFGLDVSQPGMLYAALAPCPVLGGKVASFDAGMAEKRPGVRKVVNIGDGVAVVADHYWMAKSALADLKIQWDEGPAAKLDTAAIYAKLEGAQSARFAVIKHAGDPAKVFAKSKPIEATYRAQMLAHATLEPQNCLARVASDGGVDVWVSTQFPQGAHGAAAQAAGVKPEQVRIHSQFIGGGFGRRLDFDFVPQAVLIAKALPGTPVKLIWSREDDTTHDVYRPPSVHLLRASLDGSRVQAFTHTMISPSISQRAFPLTVKDGIDDFMIEGVKNITYDIPNIDMRTIIQEVGIKVGYWRSVSNANNAWAIESFVDELAHAARQDPLAFRLAMLDKIPRQRAALERVAREAGYSAKPAKGRAFGIASMECYDTYVALVAELSGSADKVKLEKLTYVADCGVAVHPDQAIAQLEGGAVTGLINAIRSKVTLKNGRVEQTNFNNFPIPRMNEVPPTRIVLIANGEKPGGLGEVGVPLVAPAIANGVFALTGKRIRSLPLEDGGIRFV
ncbi:MAG TPA: molybdopterin cofactor-binding domain-containing protein [Burkholderiaceae bacterium]|nr:molybdopterin cofactor-binding domain-containing protein [Burkholderiaceae bacterium]